MRMAFSKKQQGFTLIELVIVIVLLGILAVTALPRFLNVISSAKSASIQGVSASLSSAVNIAHAQWLVHNSTNIALDGNTNILVNASGWPICSPTNSTATTCASASTGSQACVDIWNNILQNPPSVCTTAGTSGCQYVASFNTTSGTCSYTLQGLSSPGNAIVYTTSTGSVAVQ